LLLSVGIAGWLLLAAALVSGVASLVAPALAVFGGGYALSLGDAIDGRAPLFAGLLLLVAELAYWTLALRVPVAAEAGTFRTHGITVAVTVSVGVVLAALLVALSAVPLVAGGVAWELVGILAAGGALALVVALARPQPAQVRARERRL
jgi:hypothetical protein